MTDLDFPLICYKDGDSPREWGNFHGEEYKIGIRELSEIRWQLMQARNAQLSAERIEAEANIQWETTKEFYPTIWEELDGIREGAGLSVAEIVVLNNYTDFRDIHFQDEGCSTVYVEKSGNVLCGQTWDMHSSAKNYVCVIRVPYRFQTEAGEQEGHTYLFSLVGCVGMMGFNPHRCMIGVNNLNGQDAQSGVIWPAMVRAVLQEQTFAGMENVLMQAKVTSGHAYLYASLEAAKMVELFPTAKVVNAEHESGSDTVMFHTNHCLAEETRALESASGVASTTTERYILIEKKIPKVKKLEDLYKLLTDHENEPKSICSHFESGAQDPSFTCGGGIADLKTGNLRFWRGCPEKDANYREFELSLVGG